ncbi:hypothetical protein PVL29_021403 [Vitis rotundifolia]|uniref:F-box protein n=1 Tax=Vitis rotundifolia TaxID=103349 RepID=A0AA38YZE5_VITRO|nr:hypothetical protein PVL29_021403 [Vitis rotundifolia]
MASGSGWGRLPEGLLHSILDYMVPIDGRIKFSAVCSQWRRVAWEHCRELGSKHTHQLPLLMVPTPDNSKVRRSLYSVTRKTLCRSQLSVPYNKRCCGSSHGWLITVDDSFVVTLFNPFSGKIISFPPLRRLESEKRLLRQYAELDSLEYRKQVMEEFSSSEREEEDEEEEQEINQEDEGEINDAEEEETEGVPEYMKGADIVSESDYSIWKAVLSVDPDLKPSDYVLMVIYGVQKRLAFIQSVDKDWTYISKRSCYTQDIRRPAVSIADIKYSKGMFYALNERGGLLSCDVSGSLRVKMVTPNDMSFSLKRKLYLGESAGGDLLRVISLRDEKYRTIEFEVHGLGDGDSDGCDRAKWNQVESLGDAALFLGGNHSITIQASDYHGCQPNSIYFSDNHPEFLAVRVRDVLELYYLQWAPYNIGVFNLEDGKFAQHYVLDPSQRLMPPPIWILPTLM